MEDTSKNFYITTTLPYVNAEPHVGFAMEIVRADVIARAKKAQGYAVFFNTGTDEHGAKLFEAAARVGIPVQDYVDQYAEKFKDLRSLLGLSTDIHFIRTTDEGHIVAAQEFWKRVYVNGYIYKKNYKIKYCVGCEEEKKESDLVDGRCAIHTNRELDIIDEENYFFKFSEFGERLLALYDQAEKEGRSFVEPQSRLNEMKEFVRAGLDDFSISRLASKMSWGVPVPGDDQHVMYVWFDALVSYISTLGWPTNESDPQGLFQKFWAHGTPVQYCGKDNTRFQSIVWQAMLMAANLPNSAQIVVNGFVTAEGGVKMSKSLGNVINPVQLVSEYGTDAVRYFVLREIGAFEDSPFTLERFKDAYNANLANGLGNLTARIMRMASTNLEAPVEVLSKNYVDLPNDFKENINLFNLQKASNVIWHEIEQLDKRIQEEEPFKVVKSDPEKGKEIISLLVKDLYFIASMLEIILPETSRKIKEAVKTNTMPETLFARKDA